MTELKPLVYAFWDAMNKKQWNQLQEYFDPNCQIRWINTGEKFTPAQYVLVNKEYPAVWSIEVEDVQMTERNIVSIIHIKSKSTNHNLRGISYFRIENGKIVSLKEYFADDETPPEWRIKLLAANK
jgi:hypothetical protein